MFTIRRANQRGYANHGWLKSYHTFSFADYHGPNHMGFRSLRVMNEDRVGPGQGFGTHAHRDMEIVSYMLDGELEHNDSMGNGKVLRPGEFQRITAGTGITHSEFNPSRSSATHFYQIWLLPKRKGIAPSYEQKRFDPEVRRNQWCFAELGMDACCSLVSESGSRIGKFASCFAWWPIPRYNNVSGQRRVNSARNREAPESGSSQHSRSHAVSLGSRIGVARLLLGLVDDLPSIAHLHQP